MTEEERWKYVDMRNECYRKRKDNDDTISYFTGFDDGYLAGAEPREKRIEELENKIADIKANCDLAIEGRDIKIMELEKENTELKEELAKWKDEWQEQVQKAIDEGYARTQQTIQLTKAKEIIMNLRNIITNDITIIDTEEKGLFFKQAVEFLKEEA